MRIAFDGRVISGNKSGVGVYAESLLGALLKLEDYRCSNVITNDGIPFKSDKINLIKTAVRLEDHPVGDIWEQFYLPFYLKKEKIDIFHSPTFHLPFFSPCAKKVVTIHDLVSFRFPETQPKGFAAYSRLLTSMAVKSADAIIVPSKAIESELLTMMDIKIRVHVIHDAPRKIFTILKDQRKALEIRKKYHLPDNYILFVGSIEPRKNLSSLLYAFASLKKEKNISQKLVICGGIGWLNENEKLLKIMDKTGIISEVIFTGYVPDEDLPALYGKANLFVYPSLYEGFGLPILEAMACGCPVITSTASSLPEVAGEAALMVNPDDIEGLAGAMRRVLTNNELRQKMKIQGIERAKMFSWERCAAETLEVYKNLSSAQYQLY